MSLLSSRYKFDFWDYSFWIWFLTNMAWNHQLPSMVGQLLFLGVSFYNMMKTHSWKFPSVLLYFIAFIATCYINIKTGNSFVPAESKFMIGVLLRNTLFGFLLYQYIRRFAPDQMCEVFLYAALFGSLCILFVNRLSTGTFVMRDIEGGINGNPMAVGNALAIICMYAYGRLNEKKYLIISLILLIFCMFAGTRKAMVALFLGISILIILNKPSKIILYSSGASVVIGVLYFVLTEIPIFYNIMGSRLEAAISLANGGEGDGSIDTRMYFIELGLDYFSESPWTGWGINCFKEIPGSYGIYSHCNYVEILFSVGLLGFIAYYLMYVSIFYNNIKLFFAGCRRKEIYVAFSLVICCLLIDYGMVSYFNRPTLLYILLIYNLVDYSHKEYLFHTA